jgi:pyrroloquinoline quinone (PQQ) biosynthesis protein C
MSPCDTYATHILAHPGAEVVSEGSCKGILIYLLLSWVFLPAIIKYFSKYLMKTKICDFVDKIFYSRFDSFSCYTPFTTQLYFKEKILIKRMNT